jgi:hypothetical protein
VTCHKSFFDTVLAIMLLNGLKLAVTVGEPTTIFGDFLTFRIKLYSNRTIPARPADDNVLGRRDDLK